MRNALSAKASSVALALSSILLCLFLMHHHAFTPMWLEGFGETVGTQLVLLGFDSQRPPGWLHLGSHSFPLAMNAYTGPAWYYVQAPPVYLWFAGYTSDPYLYRYVTILIFLANGWLFFALLSRFYSCFLSFLAALVFMTTPILFLGALTDHGLGQLMFFFPLLSALLLSVYLSSGRLVFLIAGSFALGLALLTRLESFFWLVLPTAVYLLLFRRSLLFSRWQTQPQLRKPLVVLMVASASAFVLGAAPMIAYNFLYPSENVVSFLRGRVIPRTLDSTSLTLPAKLATRLHEFWSFNLLNHWRLWELHSSNYVLAMLVLLSAAALLLRWIHGGGASPTLLTLGSLIPLSILIPSGLREEHLVVLLPLLPPLILSGFLYLAERTGLRFLPAVALATLVLANAAVSACDWQYWTHIPATRQTMLNQSDPALLGNYLRTHHRGDRILYTNIGMPQYVQYATAGHVQGKDISSWTSVSGFADAVRLALLDRASRRVFVAVCRERDGAADFILPRTRLLYEILAAYHIPYKVARLQSARNPYLYDVVVVEQGQGMEGFASAEAFYVSDILDVRVQTAVGGRRVVVGSVRGVGFQKTDVVVMDGHAVPTFFGDGTWLSFSAPIEVLGGRPRPFQIEVVRLKDVLHSKAFPVPLPGSAGPASRR